MTRQDYSSGAPVGDAKELLNWVGSLKSNVRAARQGSWLPVFSAGLLTLAASWLYLPAALPLATRSLAGPTGTIATSAVGGAPLIHPGVLALFWAVAIPVWYGCSALYYRRRSFRSGYQAPVKLWLLAGCALGVVLATSVPVGTWLHLRPTFLPWTGGGDWNGPAVMPLFVIVLALPVLAWAEKSLSLLVASLVLVGAVLLGALYQVDNVLGASRASIGTTANVALIGLVFLISGTVLYALQREDRSKEVITLP